MYKEQEKLKTIKTHKDVHKAYAKRISGLPTYSTIFFPVRVSVYSTTSQIMRTLRERVIFCLLGSVI